MTIDVSVIATAYNVRGYIERAIRSALSQTGVNVEVIVADDCSGDGTWEVICGIADARLKRLRLESNGGPSVARNAAIALASGEWIAVLDGDDAFAEGRLARCVAKARSQNADIVVDNLTVRRESDGAEFPMFPPAAFARFTTLDLAAFINSTVPGAGNFTLGYVKPLFSTAFLKKRAIAYNPALRIGEDYQIIREAFASGAVCAVEQSAGYMYTVRSGSISQRLSLGDITRMLDADAEILSRCTLSAEEAKAQKNRENYLKREYAFIELVTAIKGTHIAAAAKVLLSRPGCAVLLWRPARARLSRLWGKTKKT